MDDDDFTDDFRSALKKNPTWRRGVEALLAKGRAADGPFNIRNDDPRDSGYCHPASYGLCLYVAASGDFEIIWNSCDASPRAEVELAATGERASVVRLSCFMPHYTPAYGERVMVPLTEQRARITAREKLDELKRGDNGAPVKSYRHVAERMGTDAADRFVLDAVMREFSTADKPLDVINVTQGWLDDLAAARADGRVPSAVARADWPAFIQHVVDVGTMSRAEAARMQAIVAANTSQPYVMFLVRNTPDDVVTIKGDEVGKLLRGMVERANPVVTRAVRAARNKDVPLVTRVRAVIDAYIEHSKAQWCEGLFGHARITEAMVDPGRAELYFNGNLCVSTTQSNGIIQTSLMTIGDTSAMGPQIQAVLPTDRWPVSQHFQVSVRHESLEDADKFRDGIGWTLVTLFETRPMIREAAERMQRNERAGKA